MGISKVCQRIKELFNKICGKEIKSAARNEGDLAVDGSWVEIPNSAENRKTYGESENKYGKQVARANISALHDVFNWFILGIGIHKYSDSEIAEAKAHIPELRQITRDRPVLLMFD